MREYNRRKFIQTSTLGVIATSSLSLNCQRNLSSERKAIAISLAGRTGDNSSSTLR